MGENILQGYPYSRVTRQPQEPGLYPAPTGLEDRGGLKVGRCPTLVYVRPTAYSVLPALSLVEAKEVKTGHRPAKECTDTHTAG
jgi:hypothetical protein